MAKTKKQKPYIGEIATYEKDIKLFSGYINYLKNPDKVLDLNCGGDITKYDDIGRDSHVAGVLRTRTLSVIGKEWDVLPGTENVEGAGRSAEKEAQKIADFVKKVFLDFPFDAARRAILRGGILKGYAVSEIMWDYSEGDIWIQKMQHRGQHRFIFNMQNELRMLTPGNMITGEETPAKKFQVFTFGDEAETPYGVGLGREIYWPWWFKKNGIKFWLVFCDKFGMPTPHGKYPPGTPKDKQDELLDACNALQTDSAVITPDTINIELLEAARQGSINTYESLCAFMNSEISKSVLGQTLTTEIGDKGSYAASQTHNDVRADIEKADADTLCEYLNRQVIRWLVDYNFGPQKYYPKMWIDCDPPEDLEMMSRIDKTIFVDMGYRPVDPVGYIQETYGVEVNPEPENRFGNEGNNPLNPPFLRGTKSEFAEKGQTKCPVCFSEGSRSPDMADNLTENLMNRADLDPFIEQIKRLSEEVESLEELKDRLLDIYAGMDARELGNLMQRAFVAAELAGRFKAAGGGNAH